MLNNTEKVTSISITGGTGFIGRRLIKAWSDFPELELRILARSNPDPRLLKAPNARWFHGDLENLEMLDGFLAPGGVLVHLAYPHAPDWNLSRHLLSAEKLGRLAATAGVKRVVLCSSAVVVGNAKALRVDEDTVCSPVTDYERAKLGIEQTFAASGKDAYQLAVLRPTAVLGPGGRNLFKLACNLVRSSRTDRAVNYLRSSLCGRRRMNLVCVENVVAALDFLVRREQTMPHDVFLVSDDDDPLNNFRAIEIELMRRLGVADYAMPPLPLPPQILSGILRLCGRGCADPRRVYDGSRLVRAGYKKTSTIIQSLERFASYFKGISP